MISFSSFASAPIVAAALLILDGVIADAMSPPFAWALHRSS